MRRFILVAGLLVAASAAAQPLALPDPAPPPAPLPAPIVTDIALVYTAEEGRTQIAVEPWDEAGPTLGDTLGARVDYFSVSPATIALNLGDSFPLSSLQLIAHGLNGGPVAGAPHKLSIEAPAGLIDIELALQDRRLLATQPGIGRLWIESLLPRGTGSGERYRLPVVIIVR
jgi:hypothetical protein